MIWFITATSSAVALLLLAGLIGGIWPLLSVVYLTLISCALDSWIRVSDEPPTTNEHPPSGQGLAIFLGLAHFVLLVIAIYAVSGGGDHSWMTRLLCFLGFGMFFGQISNANAHELIHRQSRNARRLGTAIYVSMLFGHHMSAHSKVHHVWVATGRDPNSPTEHESFYHFWPRAWFGSFILGLRAENDLRSRRIKKPAFWTHPYVSYVVGGILTLWLSLALFGLLGLATCVALAIYAQMQLLLSDYVQHYGLSRRIDRNGKPEPVSPAHSWNSPHVCNSALLLNATRHSNHHMHPSQNFPALQLDTATMPMLPRSLPAMAMVAMVPKLWRKVMNPRVAAFHLSQKLD